MEQALAVIFWLGQACFVIQTDGVTILTDPFNAQVGYEVTQIPGVDVVTVSHEHFDHNNVAMAEGSPAVLRGLAKGGKSVNAIDEKVKGVRIYTVSSYHDDAKGAKRGLNAIFVFEVPLRDALTSAPLRIVHMGDFGETRLDPERIKAIGPVDVLLVPVGGFYTIDAAGADQLLADLHPKIVVPMHWKTAKTEKLPIQSDSEFLKNKKHVLRGGAVSGNRLMITRGLLKQAQDAGEPLIAPLEFGPPPKPAKGR